MKVSVPVYFVALAATFVYGILKGMYPDLPFTSDQIQWLFVLILGLLGVDVTAALRAQGLLPKK